MHKRRKGCYKLDTLLMFLGIYCKLNNISHVLIDQLNYWKVQGHSYVEVSNQEKRRITSSNRKNGLKSKQEQLF